jgi:hypothetical protein
MGEGGEFVRLILFEPFNIAEELGLAGTNPLPPTLSIDDDDGEYCVGVN